MDLWWIFTHRAEHAVPRHGTPLPPNEVSAPPQPDSFWFYYTGAVGRHNPKGAGAYNSPERRASLLVAAPLPQHPCPSTQATHGGCIILASGYGSILDLLADDDDSCAPEGLRQVTLVRSTQEKERELQDKASMGPLLDLMQRLPGVRIVVVDGS